MYRAEQGGPFFVYLPHTLLHEPTGVSEEFKDSSRWGEYGDAILELDHKAFGCVKGWLDGDFKTERVLELKA